MPIYFLANFQRTNLNLGTIIFLFFLWSILGSIHTSAVQCYPKLFYIILICISYHRESSYEQEMTKMNDVVCGEKYDMVACL